MHIFRASFAVLIATGVLCLGCQPQATDPDLEQELQSILDAAVQNNDAVRCGAPTQGSRGLGGKSAIRNPQSEIRNAGCVHLPRHDQRNR